MISGIQKMALPMSLTLFLGLIFTPVSCAASLPTRADADVPVFIAQQLLACAMEHKTHLGSAQHSISFQLEFAEDGRVDSVALRDSTLGDEGLEVCMAGALRSLSVDELQMRGSENGSRTSVAPESRALLGQEQALLCLYSPPCLFALGMLIGASFVAVQIYVHAAQSSTSKPWSPPIATVMPTATTMPTVTTGVDIDCGKVKEDCIEICSETALPTPDFGAKFRRCMRACMEAKGCAY